MNGVRHDCHAVCEAIAIVTISVLVCSRGVNLQKRRDGENDYVAR